MNAETRQFTKLERYYRVHARIYDATRWSFLFGRTALLQKVAASQTPARILEVGCGTGKNLVRLASLFPQAEIIGIDLSPDMLCIARQHLGAYNSRVTLLSMAYRQPLQLAQPFDLILFSYALSMMSPGWEHVLECASRDLAARGLIAVVDFHASLFPGFTWWMQVNHVTMNGHLLPGLSARFQPQTVELRAAYAGLWKYLLFIGEKATGA